MLQTTYLCGEILADLVDKKKKHKFRKTFIFNICKGSYGKFKFESREGVGDGLTEQYYPIALWLPSITLKEFSA